ncbi:MAG: metallophosphoesterase [Muribaculaceae bacterium]|nr:metallophosphoesterase [Muribaculaceae bacterium]
MKHFLLTAWCLLLAVAAQAKSTTSMHSNSPYKIMVISDLHLLAPSLYDDGKAAMQLEKSDMKMVLASDRIMQGMTDEIIKEKPQLLFITGDLTLNGSRASHEQMVKHLQRLQQAGIKTLVIPGNHDIMCPYSKSYIGNEPTTVANITSEEFAQLYHDFGYDDSSQRDTNSLSYTCEPLPGLVILGIDSNRYAKSRDEEVKYHTDGGIKPETLEWIKQQLNKAQASGKRVIALMHHHLVEHIDGEALLLPNYIVSNHLDVAQVLQQGGVKAVFTGHLHITDAATEGGITDIATGSASTYPLPMRIATIDPTLNTMTLETRFFDGIDKQVLNMARAKIEGSADALSRVISMRMWPRLEKRIQQIEPLFAEQGVDTSKLPRNANDVTALISKHLREPLKQSLMAVTLGGEDPAQAPAIVEAVKQGVRGMVADIFDDGADDIADFLITNLMPRVETAMRSALEDINHVGTDEQATTHDHHLTVNLTAKQP